MFSFVRLKTQKAIKRDVHFGLAANPADAHDLSLSLSLYMGDGTGVLLDRFLHLQAKKRDTTRKHLGCPFCSFEDTASD